MTPQHVVEKTCEILKAFGDPSVSPYKPETTLDVELKIVGVRARQCTHALDYFLISTPKKGRLKVREFKKSKTVGVICLVMIKKALGVTLTINDISPFIQ
jgi:hypothetical protein